MEKQKIASLAYVFGHAIPIIKKDFEGTAVGINIKDFVDAINTTNTEAWDHYSLRKASIREVKEVLDLLGFRYSSKGVIISEGNPPKSIP